MIATNKVIENLKANKNIDPNCVDGLEKLINVFRLSFPDVDLTEFSQRILTVDIKEANKYIVKKPLRYLAEDNKIEINPEEVSKGYDQAHLMMIGLLKMITAGNKKDEALTPLYEGYEVIIANNLVGNNGELSPCETEQILINQFSSIVPIDIIKESYFNGKEGLLADRLMASASNHDAINKLFEIAKYCSKNPTAIAVADMQFRIIDLFASKHNQNKEDIENLQANLVDNLSYINVGNNKDKYSLGVNTHFENNVLEQNTMRKVA